MSADGDVRTDPSLVECSGDGLSFGYVNLPIEAVIDTRNAGPGELEVYCNGSTSRALCELQDHEEGVFILIVRAQEPGTHQLFITFAGRDVPGSPFNLRVSSASLIRLAGTGLQDGLKEKFKGEFSVDTRDAGHGEAKIRIGGPPGAFKLSTKKKGSMLNCKYHPKKCGIYVVNIIWQGDHVPGSPFNVFVCDTREDLEKYRYQTHV